MADILVVDDEPSIRRLLADTLSLENHVVRTADSAATARRQLADGPVDLVILDIAMPGEDGLSLARYVRSELDVGIVMLTASGTVIDRIVGLEIGADDYLPKPFEPDELVARVDAVLRRRRSPAGRRPGRVVTLGRFHFDRDHNRLTSADGELVPLTAMEAELLAALVVNAGRVLNRNDILDLVPPRDDDAFDRSIDNRIQRLRRKIEVDPSRPRLIKTVHGAGYVLVLD